MKPVLPSHLKGRCICGLSIGEEKELREVYNQWEKNKWYNKIWKKIKSFL